MKWYKLASFPPIPAPTMFRLVAAYPPSLPDFAYSAIGQYRSYHSGAKGQYRRISQDSTGLGIAVA
eukprot:1476680-Rhodomonas_salina.1